MIVSVGFDSSAIHVTDLVAGVGEQPGILFVLREIVDASRLVRSMYLTDRMKATRGKVLSRLGSLGIWESQYWGAPICKVPLPTEGSKRASVSGKLSATLRDSLTANGALWLMIWLISIQSPLKSERR